MNDFAFFFLRHGRGSFGSLAAPDLQALLLFLPDSDESHNEKQVLHPEPSIYMQYKCVIVFANVGGSQHYAAAIFSASLKLDGSIWIPGPIVELMVIPLM